MIWRVLDWLLTWLYRLYFPLSLAVGYSCLINALDFDPGWWNWGIYWAIGAIGAWMDRVVEDK